MYQKAAHVKLIEKGTDDNVPKQQFSYNSVVYGIDWMKRRKKKLDRSHSQNNDD